MPDLPKESAFMPSHSDNQKNKNLIKLYDLIDSQEPEDIYNEIVLILDSLGAGAIVDRFRMVYEDIVRLFYGEYSGYRASNTKYHNLEHTTMVTLAATRLIDGYVKGGGKFDPENILMALLAALYHDSGLIQTVQDRKGTGAKYTIGHEERSVAFMRKNLADKPFSDAQVEDCAQLIKCTNLDLGIEDIGFRTTEIETLGKIVGSADLLAQMADRHYLEKLVLLFKEFEEAGIPQFDSEVELLSKTEGFYKNVARKRLVKEFDNVSENMLYHFRGRWGIDRDLYYESINNNIKYLKSIFSEGGKGEQLYRGFLKRGGILDDTEPISPGTGKSESKTKNRRRE